MLQRIKYLSPSERLVWTDYNGPGGCLKLKTSPKCNSVYLRFKDKESFISRSDAAELLRAFRRRIA